MSYAPTSRTLLVLHEGATVAIGTGQSARPMLEAATTFAQMVGLTMRRWKAYLTSAIGIISPAETIATITPVFTIPKPGACPKLVASKDYLN